MKQKTIKDIYVGKPDAKDEIGFDGLDGFINSFVIHDTFNINGLLNGSQCYITGYKGTGKTALLFYLEYLFKMETPYACSSFIFFKDELTEVQKQEYVGVTKRLLSTVTIENDILLETTNLEYIWRWLFFKRFVSDNNEVDGVLFENDDAWRDFSNTVGKIKAPSDMKRTFVPQKIRLALPVKEPTSQLEISPEIDIDFQQNSSNPNYRLFVELIDEAEKQFAKLTRTDCPYFIFVDELEAYLGDEAVFKRDLHFIRDLIFTIKRLNSYFISSTSKTKIICSVRTEIINAISRFIVSKEINKIINGFEVPLIWDYSNTNSYMHPIIQVLLKRIYISEETDKLDYKDIYSRWFPESVHDIEPANYILNNGWNKPRDIVRLISAAQSSMKCNEATFNQSVFDVITKKYSADSLMEIKEEMRALYSAADIDLIVNCFTGFKTIFSITDLKSRISSYYKDSILDGKFNYVIQDLYRLGFLGNYMPASQTYRWQHKGNDGVIFTQYWRLMIHYALHSALSVSRRQDIGISRSETLEKGDIVNVTITRVIPAFALVEFSHFGKKHYGSIHISKLTNGYIGNINDIVTEGDEARAMILEYNQTYQNWSLALNFDADIEDHHD